MMVIAGGKFPSLASSQMLLIIIRHWQRQQFTPTWHRDCRVGFLR